MTRFAAFISTIIFISITATVAFAEEQEENEATEELESQATDAYEPLARRIRSNELQGFGTLIGGIVLVPVGVGMVSLSAYLEIGPGTSAASQISLATIGTIGFVSGVTMVILGAVLMRRERRASQRLVVAPLVSPTSHGGVFGLSGSF